MDSILAQTYRDWELLVVDDGSDDTTASIAQKYTDTDKRVKVIRHESNKGLFATRITGVKKASGEYIGFVDSDDYLSSDYYRLLVKKAAEENSDITIGDFFLEYPNGRREYYNNDPIRNQCINLSGDAIMDTFMTQAGAFYGWQLVWNKLYKTELWKKCLPEFECFSDAHPHLNMTEDMAFSARLWCNATRVVNAANAVYFYYRSDAQMTDEIKNLSSNKKKLKDVEAAFAFFESSLHEAGVMERYEACFNMWKRRYGFLYRNLFDRCPEVLSHIDKDLIGVRQDDAGEAKSTYYYNLVTEDSNEWDELERIKTTIADELTKVVSFDVFDTCLIRPFLHATDLFAFMDGFFADITCAVSAIDYEGIRVESERLAREKCRGRREDITIDDIFTVMSERYGIDADICAQLKEKETELELRFSKPRAMAKELYDLAVDMGKTIVFTSDMYLPKKTIEQMLIKNSFTSYFDIFVSGEMGVAKYSGNLYKAMIKRLGVEAGEIIHIGDNLQSDVDTPGRLGIKAFHMQSVKDCFMKSSYWQKNVLHTANDRDLWWTMKGYIGYRTMLAMAANRVYDNPFIPYHELSDFNASPLEIGYFVLGMYLYAVCDWLVKDIRERRERPRKVHFAARDGYLVEEAYKLFSKIYDLPVSNYLYVSRKALLFSNIRTKIDMLSIIDNSNIYNTSPAQLLDMLSMGLEKGDVEEVKSIFENKNIEFDKLFQSRNQYEDFLKVFLDEIYDRVNWEKVRELSKEYLSKNVSPEDVLFDIGYSGRGECVMYNLLGFSPDSYYIHTNSDVICRRQDIAGFKNKTMYGYKPDITGVIREYVFMKNAPSTIGYRRNENGEVEPLFEAHQSNFTATYTNGLLQKYALEFVADMIETFGEDLAHLYYRYEDATQPFEYYLHHGTLFDRSIFSDLEFEDDFGAGERIKVIDFWNKELKRVNYYCTTELIEPPKNAYETYVDDGVISKSVLHKAVYWLKNDKAFFVKRMKDYLSGNREGRV